MRRVSRQPRPDWRRQVEEKGFSFHTTPDGEAYWDESVCFEFTPAEIDTLEQATYALNELCLQAVQHVVDHGLWAQFGVPPQFVDFVRKSWEHEERTVYGRFDLLYDGSSPPKLAEYNADTPTSLLEAAVIQWFWLQDVEPQADQFNSIHERLLEVWRLLKKERGGPYTFIGLGDHVEDFVTANYLRDLAIQAGLLTQYLPIEQVGWNAARRKYVDLRERSLEHIFKLYPWEWLFREPFGRHLPEASTRWLEPPWKVLLSNKALLPLLWELFPDHPNLLQASWQPLPAPKQVRKPTQGREGANVSILEDGEVKYEAEGPYGDGPFVYQEFFPTPRFDGCMVVLGSWLVNGHACGLGVREDDGPVTSNASRFVPHLFR